MTRTRMWIARNRAAALLLLLAAIGAFVAAAIGVATATDQPSFCMGSCHEMRPFHAAWEDGPHAEVSCVECHVDPGTASRVAHKVVAMKELWSHLTSEPAFPLDNPSPIPDERCLRCHENPTPDDPNFNHAAHANGRACQSCHADAGHEVTEDALRQAGILNEDVSRTSVMATSFAQVDGGRSNIAGHKVVSCERCHDMAATGCPTCHTPRHDSAGPARKVEPCTACHQPGDSFVFAHPAKRTDCTACHTPPAEDHTYDQPCASCHATGVSFDFRHPTSKDCAGCHDAPPKHRDGACVTCHKSAGKSWAFKHPADSSSCTSCHDKPANHRSGSCASCHATGASWRFTHPRRSDCASCHSRPGGHYSGSCASCHSTGRSWRAATFRHPHVPGGEHTYRSFRCKACHPSGYGSHACNTCHDGDDDD